MNEVLVHQLSVRHARTDTHGHGHDNRYNHHVTMLRCRVLQPHAHIRRTFPTLVHVTARLSQNGNFWNFEL